MCKVHQNSIQHLGALTHKQFARSLYVLSTSQQQLLKELFLGRTRQSCLSRSNWNPSLSVDIAQQGSWRCHHHVRGPSRLHLRDDMGPDTVYLDESFSLRVRPKWIALESTSGEYRSHASRNVRCADGRRASRLVLKLYVVLLLPTHRNQVRPLTHPLFFSFSVSFCAREADGSTRFGLVGSVP